MKSWIQSIKEQSGKKNDGSINVNEELILKKKKELENFNQWVLLGIFVKKIKSCVKQELLSSFINN